MVVWADRWTQGADFVRLNSRELLMMSQEYLSYNQWYDEKKNEDWIGFLMKVSVRDTYMCTAKSISQAAVTVL